MREKIFEKLIDQFWDKMCSFIKILILGYDRAEVIQMNKAVSAVSLRVDEHLRKRQKKFIIMNYLICIIISLLWKAYALKLSDVFANWLSEELKIGLPDAANIAVQSMIVILLAIHTTAWMYLTEIFNSHLYGYQINRRKLRECIKYCSFILTENIMWFMVELLFVFTADNRIYWIMVGLLSCGILLEWFVLATLRRGKAILEFDVRERGYINKNSRSVDGEKDIYIQYKNGSQKDINVFFMNMYIVEDGNILLVRKDVHEIIEKEDIEKIVVNNHSDVHVIVAFNSDIGKWESIDILSEST